MKDTVVTALFFNGGQDRKKNFFLFWERKKTLNNTSNKDGRETDLTAPDFTFFWVVLKKRDEGVTAIIIFSEREREQCLIPPEEKERGKKERKKKERERRETEDKRQKGWMGGWPSFHAQKSR